MDEAKEFEPSEAGPPTKVKEKPARMIVSDLSNEEYDDIFKAVLERYPPVSSQDLQKEKEETEKDDFETIIENDEDLASHYVDKFLSQNEDNPSEAGSDEPKDTTTSDQNITKVSNNEQRKSIPQKDVFSPIIQQKKSFKKKKDVEKHKIKKKVDAPESPKTPMRTPKWKSELRKSNSKSSSKKQRMKDREIEETGTWVQCGKTSCMKWRYLEDIHDPSEVPEHWNCTMNTNKVLGSCEAPEEEWDESEHIFTKFTEGSIVWARLPGYPYWPAMVEIDPDYDTFFTCSGKNALNIVTKYHVVFFDDKVSRAWVQVSHVKPFCKSTQPGSVVVKGHNYKRPIERAKQKAQSALDLPIKERLETHSFAHRYRGRWGADPEPAPGTSKSAPTTQPTQTKIKENERKRKRPKTVIENFAFEEDEEEDIDNVEEIIRSAESVLDDFLSNHSQNSGLWSNESSPPKKKPKLSEKKEKSDKKKGSKNEKAEPEKKKAKKEKSSNETKHPETVNTEEKKDSKAGEDDVSKTVPDNSSECPMDDDPQVDCTEKPDKENADVTESDGSKDGNKTSDTDTKLEKDNGGGDVEDKVPNSDAGKEKSKDVTEEAEKPNELATNTEKPSDSTKDEETNMETKKSDTETKKENDGGSVETSDAASSNPKKKVKKAKLETDKKTIKKEDTILGKSNKDNTPAKKIPKAKKAKDNDTPSKITPAKTAKDAPTPAKTPKKKTPKKTNEPKPVVKKPNFDAKKKLQDDSAQKTKDEKENKENAGSAKEKFSKEMKTKEKSSFKAPSATSNTDVKKKPSFSAPKKTLGVKPGIKKTPTVKQTTKVSEPETSAMESSQPDDDDEPSAMNVLKNKLKKKKTMPDLSTESDEEDEDEDDKKPKAKEESKESKEQKENVKLETSAPTEANEVDSELKTDTNTSKTDSEIKTDANSSKPATTEDKAEADAKSSITSEKGEDKNVNMGQTEGKSIPQPDSTISENKDQKSSDDDAPCSVTSSQGSQPFDLEVDAVKKSHGDALSGEPENDETKVPITAAIAPTTQQNDEDSDFSFEE